MLWLSVAPEDWAELQLEFHPSVQYLELTTNAQALFKALSEEQPPPQPAILARPQPWLLWRQDLKTQYRSLDARRRPRRSQRCAPAARSARMCEALCEWHDADEVPLLAAGMLKRWLVEPLLISVG